MKWFISVQNQVYGPYSEPQMQSFVNERRVNARSLISNAPAQGFFPAISYDVFSLWAGSGQIVVGSTVSQAQISTKPSHLDPYKKIPEAPTNPVQQSPQHHQNHVFIIMAEIHSDGLMAFIHTLQRFGISERIGDTIWLVKSAYAVEQIRNAVSQCLNRHDRLFILDTNTATPAWFNIGADLDYRIRKLFENDTP